MPVRGALALVLVALPLSAPARPASADDPHDCELLKSGSDEVLKNTGAAVDQMEKASQDQGRDAAKDAASAIVSFRQAADAAKLLATGLQTPERQAAAAKLDQALDAQADAFQATIAEQGGQGAQDRLRATSNDLKAALDGLRQAVRSLTRVPVPAPVGLPL